MFRFKPKKYGRKTFQRIKELTELQGTSGFEQDVRAYMREAMTPLVDEINKMDLAGSSDYVIIQMQMHHA